MNFRMYRRDWQFRVGAEAVALAAETTEKFMGKQLAMS